MEANWIGRQVYSGRMVLKIGHKQCKQKTENKIEKQKLNPLNCN